MANTLAYYDTAMITSEKGFTVQTPRAQPVKKSCNPFTTLKVIKGGSG